MRAGVLGRATSRRGFGESGDGRITSWGEEGDYVESLDYHDVLSKALRGRIRNV
ncbi:hypothetical protein [Lysobacter firmicutimachus]|uniref:Uncharacterized protein n=1 Tax=Lysobacter firmicutimachus TaxID=1792846 RepID=A0ABU8D015_9GAMM